ncbi:MAG: methyltransferase domain-containing protein [Streptosporangiaceae bacterium]
MTAAGSRAAGSSGPGAGQPDATARAEAAVRSAQQAVMRVRHAATKASPAADSEAQRGQLVQEMPVREIFGQPIRDYLYQVLGRPIAVLRGGCRAPVAELGLDKLRASGFEISITTVDQDGPAARATASGAAPREDTAGPAKVGSIIVGDLRMVSLPARSFDIVYCGFLLERIPYAALVLDRFVAALRPGGLLLLRLRDRDCAAAALDRMAPGPVRRMLWARLHAGEPGPFPAIYDPVTSARGLQAYTASHGLVIVRHETARTVPGPPGHLTSAIGMTRALIAWLSRGRLTDAHDEMLYVIRKPEDRFARLV